VTARRAKNVGYAVSRNTIKRILKEQGIEPAPLRRRQYSWATFIKAHFGAITAADFFTVEVLSLVGLVRYHVFFVIDLASRRVEIAGISRCPDGLWMEQWRGTFSTPATGSSCGDDHREAPRFDRAERDRFGVRAWAASPA
jgi:hypothetical protein